MQEDEARLFLGQHKFQDDVGGQITLNELERDVIDTPEFQRRFRTSQLGFVDLVYPTANHMRGAHSIGACHIAGLLIDHLQDNAERLRGEDPRYADIQISPAERVLIRLGVCWTTFPMSHFRMTSSGNRTGSSLVD